MNCPGENLQRRSPKGSYSQVTGLDRDRTLESISTDEAIGIPYSAEHLSGLKTEYLPKRGGTLFYVCFSRTSGTGWNGCFCSVRSHARPEEANGSVRRLHDGTGHCLRGRHAEGSVPRLGALVAAGVSLAFFLAARKHLFHAGVPAFEPVMLLADSLGLGVFTAAGVSAAVQAGFGDSIPYCVFLGALTGVGGGTLRDVLAGLPPYIFVKHIYACASIAGGIACALLWRIAGQTCAVMVCFSLVFLIRILAARFRWSLPKAV